MLDIASFVKSIDREDYCIIKISDHSLPDGFLLQWKRHFHSTV